MCKHSYPYYWISADASESLMVRIVITEFRCGFIHITKSNCPEVINGYSQDNSCKQLVYYISWIIL